VARPDACRRLPPTLPVLAALCLASCTYPTVTVAVLPGRLTLLQGESGTVTVFTHPPSCVRHEEEPEPIACQDVSGRVFDYVVEGVPPGVGYHIDTSLASVATPGVARITFDADAEAPLGEHYRVVLHAVVSGRSLGRATLELRVLGTEPAVPAAGAVGIAAGDAFSLAAAADGSVRAWGTNPRGHLGVGDALSRSVPSLVGELDGIVAVAAGARHALALTADGRLWAWGANESGQLGNDQQSGPFGGEAAPVAVMGIHNVQAIAAAEAHSLALRTDGTVWAWGQGLSGKLGNGDTLPRLVPTPVVGLPRARAIAAGEAYSLAVALDGTVWIWGVAALGVDSPGTTRTPVQVPGLSGIRALATHSRAALAVDQDGRVWAWGSNQGRRLGDGTTTDRVTPAPVEGLPPMVAVAVGVHHAMALAADGTVWDWGINPRNAGGPQRFVPGIVPDLAGVAAIAAGAHHSLALLDCGQVWGWGDNGYGALGRGTFSGGGPPMPAAGTVDEDCDQVLLRVSLAGPDGASFGGPVSADPGALAWNRVDYVSVRNRGTTVALTARADEGEFLTADTFTFDGWAGDCQGEGLEVSVGLDRSKHCVARYHRSSPPPRLLTVSGGPGGVVSSPGWGILGPEAIACGATCQAIFRDGTVVDLTAASGAGFGFSHWSLDCAGTEPQASVVMSGPRRCAAHFVPYVLSTTVSAGGRITSEPPGLDCGAACSFAPGVGEVRLTATPDLGFAFDSWSGDCTGTAGEAVVAMDAGKSCHATFRRIPGSFLLSTVVEGEGSVTSAPDGINCPGTCLALYPAGTAVDLTAHETPRSLLSFWLDDCAAPGTATNRLVMDSDKQCRVRFVGQPAYPVSQFTFAPAPHVGRVLTFDGTASHVFDPVTGTSDPRLLSFSWDFDADGAFEASGSRAGTAVAQHAFQTAGDHAALLRVVGGPFDTSDVSVETVTVQEAVAPLFGLTVAKSGTGLGTLATDPPGLFRCGSGCDTAGLLLEAGTLVTLTAEPSGDSTFSGWSGAGCTATGPTVQVTMSEARSCTATFDAAPAGPFTLTVVVAEPAAAFVSIIGVQPASNTILCRVSGGPTCTQSFPADSMVVVRPSDSSIELGLFPIWTGCDAVGALFACTVTLTGNRTVTASFGP
jgi:alpha-tubulin suppressor-like RCC1 family protein